MAIRRILQLGDPLLRQRSQPVPDIGACAPTLTDLRDTLHSFQRDHGFGRGISAVQIGIAERIMYIEINGGSYSLINPAITRMSPDTFTLWDDCFSFPNLMVRLERSRSVDLQYFNEAGKPCSLQAVDAFSELLQHEMDHLDGVLAVDRALDRESLATREEWLRTYAAR